MKKLSVILSVLLFFVVSLSIQAQNNVKEYFIGKWNVTVNGPNGDVKMVVGIEKKDGNIIGSINDTEGKELYKVINTTISEESATVTFIGTQGSDVPMYLKRKDEDHVTGDIMSMFNATGERIKD